MRRLENELDEYRLTLEEFRAEGEADTLTDGNLRDLWLHYRPLLFDNGPRDGPGSHCHSLDVERDQDSGGAVSARRSADGGDQGSVSEMPPIRYVTREELWQEMEAHLAEERMTVEEFRAQGEANTLTDAHLRDLWLWYRPLLFDE